MRESGKMRLRRPLFAGSAPSRWRLWTNRYTPTAPAVAWLVLLPIRRQAPSRNLALNFNQLIPLRRIQIIVLSQVEPKLGTVAEVLRQAKSRIGLNRTFPLDDRLNPIRRHMKFEAERTSRQAEGRHKLLLQDLARRDERHNGTSAPRRFLREQILYCSLIQMLC
jgi:hypothetical protein